MVGYLRTAGLYPAFDPPAFNQYGGLVTNGFQPVLSTTSGTIYYTLDGSDPRLAGGGISPAALVWVRRRGDHHQRSDAECARPQRQRPMVGPGPAALPAGHAPRAHGPGSCWSPKINYNPPGSDEFEFIELYNASTNLLDLSGVSLSNAVRFVFPNGFALAPGAFVLVVENTASFAARYQTPGSPYYFPGLTVAGEWVGALDNAGETFPSSPPTASNLPPCPIRPAATGRNGRMARAVPSSWRISRRPAPATEAEVRAFLADGRNWTSSSLYHGSPGRFDTSSKSVRINEILAHTELGTDWLELLNTGDRAGGPAGLHADRQLWICPASGPSRPIPCSCPGQFSVLSVAGLALPSANWATRSSCCRCRAPM